MSDVENEGESAGLQKFTGDQSTGVQLEIRLDQAGGLLHIFNEIQDNIEYCDESEIDVLIKKTYIAELCNLPSVTKDVHSLRKFNTSFQKHVRSLKSLGEPVDQWSSLLIYLMTKKLDSKSDSAWQEHLINFKIKSPSLENFTEFLNDRCQLLESTAHECKVEKSNGYAEFKSHNKKNDRKDICRTCYANSRVPLARLSNVRRKAQLDAPRKRCRRRRGDRGARNPQRQQKYRREKTATQTSGLVTAAGGGELTTSEDVSLAAHHSQEHTKDTNILLPTAIVLIKDSENRWHECRALLDSGSQPNFMTRKISDRLHLKSVGNGTPVMGVGATSTNINKKVLTTIKSMHSDYTVKLTFLVLDQITVNMPNYSFKTSQLQLPTNISLADPQFNT
nr:unnamed protein product [Callosobruchus chinensis]